MSDPLIWIALAACGLSCYFAACHIAIKTFSRTRLLELLEQQGRAERLGRFTRLKVKLLLMTGALRVCLSLMVLLAILGYLERGHPRLGVPARNLLAFLLAGMLVSMFVVVVPVRVVRSYREQLLAKSLPFLQVCLAVFWPIAVLLHGVDAVVRRVLGDGGPAHGDHHLSEDILSFVQEHDSNVAVDEGQKEMIEAVVEFPTTTVGQIMTPRTDVHGIDISLSLKEVRAAVLKEGHSRIPVYEQSLDHIVGILYTKDLIEFIGNDRPFELRKILRDALMVPESKPVRELLAEFKARKVHIAIVLDEYGGTAGLVTIEDIIEEIVGEIQDEYEPVQDSPHIRRLDDFVAEVDARVYIDDLNDELGLALPESKDYDTVGGFVFSTLGHIPVAGEQFQFSGVGFTVTAAERTKVIRVHLDMAEAKNTNGRNGNGSES